MAFHYHPHSPAYQDQGDRRPASACSQWFRPALERLEDRLTPSISIALQEAGVNGVARTVVASGADFASVNFSGTYGDFTVNVFGGAAHNGLQAGTFSDLLSSTTVVINNSGSTATLNLFVTETNYTLSAGPNLNVESGLGGSVSTGTLALNGIFQAYADKNNNLNGLTDFTNGVQNANGEHV
jgi:hypothetical protein